MRYLKNIVDGFIYEWNEILAENSLCREVSEEEAYPERFIPEDQKGRKAKVDLTTDPALIPQPPTGNEELNAEVTRLINQDAAGGAPRRAKV